MLKVFLFVISSYALGAVIGYTTKASERQEKPTPPKKPVFLFSMDAPL